MSAATLVRSSLLVIFLCHGLCLPPGAAAQSADKPKSLPAIDGSPARPPFPNKVGVDLLKNIGTDQQRIWTSPIHLRGHDAKWLIPFAGATAGLVYYDADISRHVATHPSLISISNTMGTAGLAATAAAAGGFYVLGRWKNDEHRRETGYLAGLSLIDGFVVTEAFKYSFRRQRPNQGDGTGPFFSGGVSFFSEHSMAAWSVAAVIAHEYPGSMTKFLAYSAASAISISRVTAYQHFPSDVVVGSTFGYLIGREVYRAHHSPDVPGVSIGTFVRAPSEKREAAHNPANLASPFVPLDSWVYPLLDRMMAQGYIRSEMLGLKPWTRIECARLVREFEDRTSGAEGRLGDIDAELSREFAPELAVLDGGRNSSARIESVYTQVLGISGDSLRDSYHFGTTIENNYGRPYAPGVNAVLGASASATAGLATAYVRAEYQYAPSAPYYSQSVLDQIQLADFKPLVSAPLRFPGANRVRFVDAYVSLAHGNYQFSFGKQSLWWGPIETPLIYSDNAEPIPMLRVTRTTPFEFPGIFRFLGKVRTEYFLGRLSGQHFVNTEHGAIFDRQTTSWVGSLDQPLSNQPFIHGEKITFKPTPNFEFAVSRTGLFGGPDFPVTLGRLGHVYFSTAGGYSAPNDPGDRRSSFDFTWRLPWLRNWATLYMDAFTEDELSPLAYWRKSAIIPGIYISRLPRMPRFDFRAEGGFTNAPGVPQPDNFGFFYWNIRYLDGYTNDGVVLGSTIPRRGREWRVSSTYWVSPRSTVRLGFVKNILDPHFLKGGSDQKLALTSAFDLSHQLSLSNALLYEWYRFPLLGPSEKQSFSASLQLTYRPARREK